jgi:hypothetical protein
VRSACAAAAAASVALLLALLLLPACAETELREQLLARVWFKGASSFFLLI